MSTESYPIDKVPEHLKPMAEAILSGKEERPILMVDSLGFSEKIYSESLDKVYFRQMALFSIAAGSQFPTTTFPISFLAISDSIVFYHVGHPDQGASLKELVGLASRLVANSMFTVNAAFPIRGGIAFGGFIAESDHKLCIVQNPPISVPNFSVLMGKPVVDVYRWERSQKWIGISIAPMVVDILKKKFPNVIDELQREKFLVEWSVPTEIGLVRTLAVNIFHKLNSAKVIASLKNELSKCTHAKEKAKYIATLEFCDFVRSKGLEI